MKRTLIVFALIIATCMVLPRPTHALANLPQIIPECDQTRYIVQRNSPVGPNGPLPITNESISPDLYGQGKAYPDTEWTLIGYTTNDNCTLNDFLQVFVNLFSWGLYIISILGLLFLFIGGGTLLLSGGSEERVRSGKSIITNTVIGIAIALGSWLVINTLYIALLPEGSTKNGVAEILNNQPWFRTSASKTWGSCSEPPEYPCKGGPGASTVRDVQGKLYDQGCYANAGTRASEVDGSFGPKTLAAWNFWQRWNMTSPTTTIQGYDGFKNPCTLNLPLIPQ